MTNWITQAREAHQGIGKPTEVDSMNRLRVQAENKAALYRRALELACYGDKAKVAFYVAAADADPADEDSVTACETPEQIGAAFRAWMAQWPEHSERDLLKMGSAFRAGVEHARGVAPSQAPSATQCVIARLERELAEARATSGVTVRDHQTFCTPDAPDSPDREKA